MASGPCLLGTITRSKESYTNYVVSRHSLTESNNPSSSSSVRVELFSVCFHIYLWKSLHHLRQPYFLHTKALTLGSSLLSTGMSSPNSTC